MNEQDVVLAFRQAMEGYDIAFKGPVVADDKLHRVHVNGDHKGSRNGWYVLHLDGVPAGAFGCKKRLGDQVIRWSMKGAATLTREERRALAEKSKADRERREREEREAQERAAVRADRIWNGAREVTEHPYLARKGVSSYGLRVTDWKMGDEVVRDTLLVPIRDEKKRIVSLQAIFPTKNETIGRDKHFLAGGRKQGAYFVIGRPTELAGVLTVILCEGFATGASIHAATGAVVIVCFDAGNLIHVAKLFRSRMPEARIIIAGDNDRWTEKPIVNPGVTRAREAAAAVNGLVAVPEFQNVDGKPTDFNDLHKSEGLDEVRRQVLAALAPPQPAAAPSPAMIAASSVERAAAARASADVVNLAEKRAEKQRQADDEEEEADTSTPQIEHGKHFRILGYDHGEFFVYQHGMRQIVKFRPKDLSSEPFLISLAPLDFWEREFKGARGMDKAMAQNWMMRTAEKRGVYDPSMVRGRGAWIDEGRTVFHFGNRLVVDGVEMNVTKIESEYVYELAKKLRRPAAEELTDAEGQMILDVAKMFRWTRPASAVLLAGWCVLAPFCGALQWRPHIWLTGGPGSGKSTIQKDLVHFLMASTSLFAQGNSTEPGIRQELKGDALPVLFDEAEQNNDRESNRMQGVLAMTRQASTESEARTYKGTQKGESMHFLVRSMFSLSSVQVGIKHQADRERLVKLALKSKRTDPDPGATWATIKAAIAKLQCDRTLPARLMRRTMNMLPTILKNIETFAEVAASRFGTQREGDQFGTMLAGAWSLTNRGLVTRAQAEEMIDSFDWSEHLEDADIEDTTIALHALIGANIRTDISGKTLSVSELVSAAAGLPVQSAENINADVANAILKRHGMKVFQVRGQPRVDGKLLLENISQEIPRLLADTPFASDWRGQLLNIDGIARHFQAERFAGVPSKCIAVPLSMILDVIPEDGLPV